MYFGKRREMLAYFAFIEYPCPAYKNPSDYYRKFFLLPSPLSQTTTITVRDGSFGVLSRLAVCKVYYMYSTCSIAV